jgi:hypothetical protein
MLKLVINSNVRIYVTGIKPKNSRSIKAKIIPDAKLRIRTLCHVQNFIFTLNLQPPKLISNPWPNNSLLMMEVLIENNASIKLTIRANVQRIGQYLTIKINSLMGANRLSDLVLALVADYLFRLACFCRLLFPC